MDESLGPISACTLKTQIMSDFNSTLKPMVGCANPNVYMYISGDRKTPYVQLIDCGTDFLNRWHIVLDITTNWKNSLNYSSTPIPTSNLIIAFIMRRNGYMYLWGTQGKTSNE